MRLLPALVFTTAGICAAQDTRHVVEPAIPPACATLQARIGRAGISIAFEDESKLDTQRIQAALDQCTPGHSVVLTRSSTRLDSFLTGPLQLRRGVVLAVSAETYLFGSRNARDYDIEPGVCGTITEKGNGCKPLIAGVNIADSGVMGDGTIDGRGGETILGKNTSWWNLADEARTGGTQNNPRLIALKHCDNFTLYRIALMNSPNFHVGYSAGNGFTVWGVKIWAPERARNTDGIDPGNSTNITIAHSFIHTGDDQIAIKAGEGDPTTHISILHNHFYAGHGMSIGSNTDGGASAIRVSDLSIDGSDNGIRIKSNQTRGGLVHDVIYEDVCMRRTANPVFMDTNYLAHASDAAGRIPQFRDILLRNIRVEGAGKVTLEGADAAHRLGIQFNNVTFDNPAAIKVLAKYADVKVNGEDAKVSDLMTATGVPNSCVGKFVPFPRN